MEERPQIFQILFPRLKNSLKKERRIYLDALQIFSNVIFRFKNILKKKE